MPTSFDKKSRDDRNPNRNWDIKLFALPILIVIVLIGLAVSQPGANKWISEAAQAEFVGTDLVPPLVPPTRLALPANEIRTAKSY